MLRVSRGQLTAHWAFTYCEDGYEVRASDVAGYGRPAAVGGVVPDLEAIKGCERVLVYIVDSADTLDDPQTPEDLAALDAARGDHTHLHVIVAAECASGIKDRLTAWHVVPDVVHVT
jgi:hypothetical protein